MPDNTEMPNVIYAETHRDGKVYSPKAGILEVRGTTKVQTTRFATPYLRCPDGLDPDEATGLLKGLADMDADRFVDHDDLKEMTAAWDATTDEFKKHVADLQAKLRDAKERIAGLEAKLKELVRAAMRWEKADSDYAAAQIANIGQRAMYAARELDEAERELRTVLADQLKEQDDV